MMHAGVKPPMIGVMTFHGRRGQCRMSRTITKAIVRMTTASDTQKHRT